MKTLARIACVLVVLGGTVALDGPSWAGFIGGMLLSFLAIPERPR